MEELYHHGVLGQKWGIRRYQNEDGSLNEAGKKRYGKDTDRIDKYLSKSEKKFDKISKRIKVVSKHLNRKSNEKKMEKIKKDLPKAIKYSEKAKKLVNKLEHKYKKVKDIPSTSAYKARVNAILGPAMTIKFGMIANNMG